MRILTVSQVANFMDVKTQFSRCKLELAPFDVAQGTPSEVEAQSHELFALDAHAAER